MLAEDRKGRSLGTALRAASHHLAELEAVLSTPDHDVEKLACELAVLDAR